MTADEVECNRLADNAHQALLVGRTEDCCVYFMGKAMESSFSSVMEIAERAQAGLR
jgi:hypothetical protein